MPPEKITETQTTNTPNTNQGEKESPLANPEAEQIRLAQLEEEETIARYKEVLSEPDSQAARIGGFLPGIYGKVDSDEYGEFYLSLTPYETAPRLGDFGFFGMEYDASILNDTKNFTDDQKRRNAAIASATAKTVINRLQGSRVVTNFQQEILPPDLDTRFSSKTNLIGEMTRHLNRDGREADRSAFLHVVPDLDKVGGKFPIKYTHLKKDESGNIEGETRVAQIPVNFNFNNKKLSLTIKEFILNQVYEASAEEYSMTKSFDGYTLRFFGGKPRVINISGQLTNFNDDIISYSQDLKQILVYEAGTGNITEKLAAPIQGSQRDLFMTYYDNFLAGTKCRDYAMKVYLYYNFRIIEGFFIDFSITSSADNDNYVNFTAGLVVVKQFSAFETGIGLGAVGGINPGDSLAQRNLNAFSENDLNDFEAFTSDKNHRELYRSFAYKQSLSLLNKLEQRIKGQFDKTYGERKDLQEVNQQFYTNEMLNRYEPSEDKSKLEEFLNNILNSIDTAGTLVGLDANSKTHAANFVEKDTRVSLRDFIKWAFNPEDYPANKNFYYNAAVDDSLIETAITTIDTDYHSTYDSTEGSNSVSVGSNRLAFGTVAELFFLAYQNYFKSK